jgi:hypothetical protein
MASITPTSLPPLGLPTTEAEVQQLLDAYNLARQHLDELHHQIKIKDDETIAIIAGHSALVSELRHQLAQSPRQNSGHELEVLGIARPNDFDGDRTKTTTFLRQVRTFMAAHPTRFNTATTRINFALSYMKTGTAASWADRIVEEREQAEEAGEEHGLSTWAAFVDALKARFGEVDPQHTAQDRLELLRQEAKTAEELNHTFNDLAPRTGYNEASLLRLYEKALNPWIADAIYRMHPMPKTLDDWQAKAEDLDRQSRTRKAHRLEERQSRPPPLNQPSGPNPVRRNSPAQPASNAATNGHPSTDPVPMEVDRLRREGRCYQCGEKGHLQHRCPQQHPGFAIRAAAIEDMVGKALERLGIKTQHQVQDFHTDQQ